MKTTLTGNVRMRVHQRAFAPELIVAEVEEKVEVKIVCPFLNYDSVRYRWRNATRKDWIALIDPNKPVIHELNRVGRLDSGQAIQRTL